MEEFCINNIRGKKLIKLLENNSANNQFAINPLHLQMQIQLFLDFDITPPPLQR